jgi:hypothetical protein
VSKGRSKDLGPWAGDDFEKTVRTTSAVGVDSGLPDDVRFIAGVAKLIRRRIAEAGDKIDPPRPAVFLLEPTARTYRPDIAPERVPMLDNGLTAVSGRLWFVSPVVVVGSYVELEDCSDDELFRIVTDELQLGDVPAVVFDPRTKAREIRFYQNGLGDPETREVSSVSSTDVSLESIFETIDRIYEKGLVTPDAQKRAGKLWKDNERCWPMANAEYVVQLYLWAGLTTAFPMCTVRSEQDNVSGRLDLEIEESHPTDRSCFVRHAILELKVLRSYWSTGKSVSEEYTLDWVKSGVKQAASYRDERGARAAALCCFDMRRGNTGEKCFNHVVDLAVEHQVVLKVWFIYATSKQYRDATIGSTEP